MEKFRTGDRVVYYATVKFSFVDKATGQTKYNIGGSTTAIAEDLEHIDEFKKGKVNR